MTLTPNEGIKLAPAFVKLLLKLIKYAKGGLSKDEAVELAGDLLALALKIAEEAVD